MHAEILEGRILPVPRLLRRKLTGRGPTQDFESGMKVKLKGGS